MNSEDIVATVRKLAGNAKEIKLNVAQGNLDICSRLVGDRVALVETLREFCDAKVSLANSDNKDEMALMIGNMKNDVSDAIGSINARLLKLSRDLAHVGSARKIAAYKIHGGRHGY